MIVPKNPVYTGTVQCHGTETLSRVLAPTPSHFILVKCDHLRYKLDLVKTDDNMAHTLNNANKDNIVNF